MADFLSPEELTARGAQMFPSLTPEQVDRVRRFGKERGFAAGDIVFEQGEENVPFYVVLEGRLEVVHPQGGSEDPIVVHEPRQFTGEINLLTDRRSLVRGRAVSALRVLRVEHAELRSLIQTDPDLSELLMRAFILRRVGLLSAGYGDVVLIGSRDSASTLRVQAFLQGNNHPFRYVDVDHDPDVQTLLDQFHVAASDIPILICRGERVLRNPTEAEIVECLGFNATLEPGAVYDVVVCGSGPGGLAAAVYGASEGLSVLVLEAGAPGGQAASSSKIENYLGFPTGISGQALAGRALAQAEKFGARIAVARPARSLFCGEAPIRIPLANGEAVGARAVVVATGAKYRKLELSGIERFEGAGIYYAATQVEAQRCGAEEVAVVGGANSAGQAATFLARSCRRVHVLIRGPDLSATMSRYLVRRIEDTPNIVLHRRTQVVAVEGDSHLERIRWREDGGHEETRAVRHLFSMVGAKPNSEWLGDCLATDEKGFVLTGADLSSDMLTRAKWPLSRSPHLFETNRPRVFAVGDVRANSVKRVASAVGEGSVCIQLVHRVLGE